MKVAETFGKGIGELVRAKRILGISSVFGPAGERGAFAEILAFADTVLARSTRLVQPRNAHSCARLKPPRIRTALFHGTHHLVAGDQWTLPRRQLSFNHMQVGAADPAHANSDQHLLSVGLRYGQFGETQRVGFNRCGRRQNAGLHVCILAPSVGCYGRSIILSCMAKRIMVAVVGAGIGSLVGLLISSLGAGNPALIIGGLAGAAIPLLVLGPPGR